MCISVLSYCLYSWCHGTWGLVDLGESASPRASWFLVANNSPEPVPFLRKLTNPEPVFQTPSLSGSYSLGGSIPLLFINLRSGTRQLEATITAQGPVKLSKLGSLKPAWSVYLASPIPSTKTTIRLLPMFFPHSFCPLTDPDAFWCGPVWVGVPPALGRCE